MEYKKQSAFPHPSMNDTHPGLTKREYFAIMAMQGICANPTTDIKPNGEAIAIVAVECADELIKLLEAGGRKI